MNLEKLQIANSIVVRIKQLELFREHLTTLENQQILSIKVELCILKETRQDTLNIQPYSNSVLDDSSDIIYLQNSVEQRIQELKQALEKL